MAIQSLFGPSIAEVEEFRRRQAEEDIAGAGREFGVFAPLYQSGLRFGNQAARGINALFGAEDPMLTKARDVQTILSGYQGQDFSNPTVLSQIAGDLATKGYQREGFALAQQAGTLARQLRDTREVFRLVTPEEKKAAGLPEEGVYQVSNFGQVKRVEGAPKEGTGTERERATTLLSNIEANIAAGKTVPVGDLQRANLAIQLLEKPQIAVDPLSGTVTRIDPINVGSAFPNARRAAFGQLSQQPVAGTARPATTTTETAPSVGPSVSRPAPGVTVIEGRGKPLTDEQFKGLQGGFNMLSALRTVEQNRDLFGLTSGPAARAAAITGFGSDAQRAADTEAALGSIKTNVSSLIKGIPSNFDVQTFFGRIPNLNGLFSLESEQKALSKLANLKDETQFLVRSAIAYYKKNKNSIPSEFEEIAKGYGIDIGSVKPEEYTPNLQEAFDKKFNVYTKEQEDLINKTMEANKNQGMSRELAIRFLKSRNRLQ